MKYSVKIDPVHLPTDQKELDKALVERGVTTQGLYGGSVSIFDTVEAQRRLREWCNQRTANRQWLIAVIAACASVASACAAWVSACSHR